MSFLELAKRRYSVRNYKDISVEEEKLKQVLEAGRVAPSAVNFQPLHFLVAQDEEMRKRIASTYRKDWVLQALVNIDKNFLFLVCDDCPRMHSMRKL